MDREELAKRAGVRSEDVDDVIGIAAQLQEEDRASRGASVDEVKAVAGELQIDPSFVEAAIARLHSDRKRAEDEKAAAEAAGKAAQSARTRVLGVVIAALIGAAALSASITAATAWSGAHAISIQAAATGTSEADLSVALDRQLALVPQLVALAGADTTRVDAARTAAMNGASIDDRLRGSLDLDAAIGEALATLPPTTDPTASEQRLNLQYELVGARNRVDTGRRRWEEARRGWERAAEAPSGRLAIDFGWAAPPR